MSEINASTEKKSNGVFIVIILALLVGLAVMAYLWSKKNSQLNDCMNETTLLKSDMEGMNQMMKEFGFNAEEMSDDLTKNFSEMLKTYDE